MRVIQTGTILILKNMVRLHIRVLIIHYTQGYTVKIFFKDILLLEQLPCSEYISTSLDNRIVHQNDKSSKQNSTKDKAQLLFHLKVSESVTYCFCNILNFQFAKIYNTMFFQIYIYYTHGLVLILTYACLKLTHCKLPLQQDLRPILHGRP